MRKSPETKPDFHNRKWSRMRKVAAVVAAFALLAPATAACDDGLPTSTVEVGQSPSPTPAHLKRGVVAPPIDLDCREQKSTFYERIYFDGKVNGVAQFGSIWSVPDITVHYTYKGRSAATHFWIGAAYGVIGDHTRYYYNASATPSTLSSNPSISEFGDLKPYGLNEQITDQPIITLSDGKGTQVNVYTTGSNYELVASCYYPHDSQRILHTDRTPHHVDWTTVPDEVFPQAAGAPSAGLPTR